MKINAPLALFLVLFLYTGLLQAQTPTGGWGNCEFATVATMDAFDPSGSTYTCKKAYVTATDEHYRWDGSAWVLERADVENIYNTSDTLTADRTVILSGRDLTFEGTNDIFFQADGKVGINNVSPNFDLDVTGTARVDTHLFVGPNAGSGTNASTRIATNFDLDIANTFQIYSNSTITSAPLTATRTSYGAYFNLLNNKSEGTGNSDAMGGFFQVNITGTNTYRSMYGVRGMAQNSSNATSGLGTLYGGYFRAYNASTTANVANLYGSYAQARGRTGAAGDISNAYGTRSEARAYNADINNAYGIYGYAANNNNYTGNINNAYGVYGYVRVDSDDGGDITNAYAGYFQTNRRGAGSTLMNRADGIYINTNAAVTAYGARIFVDDIAADNNYGLLVDAFNGTNSNFGIMGVRGDWVLREDGDGVIGNSGNTGGGDLSIGAGDDLVLYHDGSNTQIINNTGNLNITGTGGDDVILSETTGNVGIGNASPAAKLDVDNGTVRFSDYGTGVQDGTDTHVLSVNASGDVQEMTFSELADSIATFSSSSADSSLYTIDGSLLANRTVNMDGNDLTFDATTDVVIKSSGRLGLGTPSPSQMIDVAGANKVQIGTFAGSAGGKLRVDVAAGETETQGIKVMNLRTTGQNFGVNGTAAGVGATTNTGLYGWASGATNNYGLHVDNGHGIVDDSMAIGTSSPLARLHVKEGTNFNSVIIGESENTASWSRTLTGLTPNVPDGSISGLFTFGQTDTPREAGHMYFVDDATDGDEYIGFAIRSGSWNILTMTGAGDVGIGTNTPAAKLEVAGSVRFSDHGTGTTYLDTASSTTPADIDYVLGVNSDGDVLEMNTAKSSKVFYPPPIVVDVSATGTGFTLNLHKSYMDLYAAPAVASLGAPTAIPSYASDELYYYVIEYDNSIFSGVSIDADGILSYNIDDTPADNCSVFTVVFVVK